MINNKIKSNKKTIIIGASSFIGRHVYDHFSKKGKKVIGTYFNNPKENLVYFDLKNPDLKKLNIDAEKVDFVIICSAISRPDDCKKNEQESYELNVIKTQELLKQCFESGIFPVWFSSEYVFNGKRGNYNELSERNPNTVYGKQKKEVEDFLLNSGRNFLILRLGKVFGLEKSDKTYLTAMTEQLLKGEEIKCADDQIFNSLYINDLVKVLDLCLQKGLKGLYNTASPEQFSRYDAGKIIIEELISDKFKNIGKIIPCSLGDFDFLDNRPLNTTMNTDKLIKDSGFEFKKLRESISGLVESYI